MTDYNSGPHDYNWRPPKEEAQAQVGLAITAIMNKSKLSTVEALSLLMSFMDPVWFTPRKEINWWGHPDMWLSISAGGINGSVGDAQGSVWWEMPSSSKGNDMAIADINNFFNTVYAKYRIEPLQKAKEKALSALESTKAASAPSVVDKNKVLASAKAQIAANIQKSAAVEQEKLAKKFAIAAAVLGGLAIVYKLSKKK